MSDDGPEYPEDVLSGGRRGYGLTIVRALSERYDGTVELSNNHGAAARIALPTPLKRRPRLKYRSRTDKTLYIRDMIP